jgi:potassium-dependent mechanosensitive channel
MAVLRRFSWVGTCVCFGLVACAPAAAQFQPLELFQPAAEAPPPVPTPTPAQAALAEVAAAPPLAPAQEPSAAGGKFVGLDAVKQEFGQSWEQIWSGVLKVLRTPLIAGAKPTDPAALTVGTLCVGLVLLVFGYFAAGLVSRWTASKLLTRFGLNRSAIAPIQSITFYILLATFTMFSLNVLNVPMAVFSFFGGALAIGAGFGSQNIVNNFISGLILLAERPIRVGDVIQLDSWTGTVTQIGARSTKITNGSNHEIIVPNSKLLETSVVNWTLSDDTVGCSITLGAAYGSPTREVQRLLLLAANEHPQVLDEPAPVVVFKDFGADSLLFEMKFWVNLRETNKGEVESELRFRIDELMADRGIVLAFPQRDVHLNVLRPIEVRLRETAGQTRSAA